MERKRAHHFKKIVSSSRDRKNKLSLRKNQASFMRLGWRRNQRVRMFSSEKALGFMRENN